MTALDIVIFESVDSGHEPIQMYCYGHRDPEDFLKALYAYCDAYEDSDLTASDVAHLYWKDEPNHKEDGRDCLFVKCEKSDEGAYEVTVIDVN